MENKPIPPFIMQTFLTKAGLFCSERLSVDIVYLNQCIDLLLPTFELKEIKTEYENIFGKDSWDIVMRKKKRLARKLGESKLFYDALANKTLIKKSTINVNSLDETIQKTFKTFFFRTALKIKLIESEIYNLFVFLVMNSDIQRHQIKNEYFKNLEQRENKNVKVNKDRSPEPPK